MIREFVALIIIEWHWLVVDYKVKELPEREGTRLSQGNAQPD